MFIEELTAGQEITLTANIGQEQLTFETTVLESLDRKHMILVAPVYKNDKVITFRAKGLIVNLLASPPDSSPILFKNVTINLMKQSDNSLVYSVSSQAEGKANNRRESFRCHVGIATAVQCGSNRRAHDAIIKDVSASGFSVTLNHDEEDTHFHENQVLHIVLNDYLEEIAENFNFQMYGIIVRVQELENGRTVYGCRLNNKVPGLETYIFKKERIRLRNQNGGGR